MPLLPVVWGENIKMGLAAHITYTGTGFKTATSNVALLTVPSRLLP